MTEEISDRTGRRKTAMLPFGSTGLYVPNRYSEKFVITFGIHFWSLRGCCHVAPTSAPVAGTALGWARGRLYRESPRQGKRGAHVGRKDTRKSLVLAFGIHFLSLWVVSLTWPYVGPVAGTGLGWPRGRTGSESLRQGERGAGRRDTPSRRRTVRNDEGVSFNTACR